MFDHNELSSQELESVIADLNHFIVQSDNSKPSNKIKSLEDLDLDAIERLCEKLQSSESKLKPLSIKALYSVFAQQYESASEQDLHPYAAQFFSCNVAFDDSLADLIDIHFEHIVENNIDYVARVLTNEKIEPRVAFHYLCLMEEYEGVHHNLLNILNSKSEQSVEPFADIVRVLLKKNSSWLFSLLVMQTFTREMRKIEAEEIKDVESRIEREFLSKFQKGMVSHEDMENIFNRGNLSPLKMKMVDGVATLLSTDLMSPSARKLAIEEVFVKKNAKEDDAAYMNYLAFLLNNIEEHADFLKNVETEHSFIIDQLRHYKIDPFILTGVNLEKFFSNETRALIGAQCYELLSGVILRSLDRFVNRVQIRKITPEMLRSMYEHSMTDLSIMVFIKQAHDLKENTVEDVEYSASGRVYYNNQGYLRENSNSERLFLEDSQNTPIGYNVCLPPLGVECKNIIVNVYGGYKAGTDNAYRPGEFGDFHKSLLNKGTAIITLNLPDLHELTVYQGKMPFDLHIKIHACIDKFYQTLRDNPERLHEDLKGYGLQDKPIFLYGASFGGALSIRHGQMYPGTFNGYMSHDGPLSREVSEKSDLLNRATTEIWLDPAQPKNIAEMVDPVLLLHTKSDNNVSEKETEAFYNALQKSGKSRLARVHITEVGNPIFTDKYSKGHAVPTDKDEFSRYINTVLSYMENGPAVLPAMTKWQVYRHNKLANKFYKSATLQQKFVAEVLDKDRLYHSEKSNFSVLISGRKAESDEVWDKHYKPLFYAMHYANSLCENKTELVTEIKRLMGTEILSDEVIQNALSYQASAFSQYMKENYNIEITQEQIKNNPDLVAQFRENMTRLHLKEPAYVRYVLSSLYLSNPDLLAPLAAQFEANSELQNANDNAKHKLINSLSKQRKMIAHTWQQTARKALLKKQDTQEQKVHDSTATKKNKK